MNHADVILELQATNSRLEKEKILAREMSSNNVEFFTCVIQALDKLITFGIKQIPLKAHDGNENSLTVEEFLEKVSSLKNRISTGNSAKDLVNELIHKASSHMWNNFYRRVLLKDLNCGVNVKTINKMAKKLNKPEFSVPIFCCQLASDSNVHEAKMKGKKVIEMKYDGIRVLTVVYPSGVITQFSRNGKEIVNFPFIMNEFLPVCSKINEPMVFDGEIMSSSFQELMTLLYRKEDLSTYKVADCVYYVFDVIPLASFRDGFYPIKQINRIEKLRDFIDSSFEHVKLVEYKILDLSDEIENEEFFDINKKGIENGYEGLMIKDPYAPYECKRVTSWLKLKPFISLDLEIFDLLPGEGKYSGTLGALACRGLYEGKEIVVNVGSGLSDEIRTLYWTQKNRVLNKIAEIKCDAITQNLEGSYSLRFPRFGRLRGFEKQEKI